MSLNDLVGSLRRRWWLVVLLTLSGLVGAAAYASTVPATYTASTRLYVAMATGTSVNDSYQGGLAAQQRIASYAQVADSDQVAQHVVDHLGLDLTPETLQKRITATYPPATNLLEISVTDASPEGAQRLADTVATYTRAAVDTMETTVQEQPPSARLNVLDPARLPADPTSPNVPRILAVGLLAGLALGALAALLTDRLDRRVRRPEQAAELLATPVLITVPADEPMAKVALARLCVRLLNSPVAPSGETLLVSNVSDRPAPHVVLGLAEALAATGRQVAVIDVDSSPGNVTTLLGKTDARGVADWLRTPREPLHPLVHFTESGVGVLPIGAADQRTSGLLSSTSFDELISNARTRFDYVLIAAGPMPVEPATLTMASRCGSALAVVELGRATRAEVSAAVDGVGPALIGAIALAPPAGRLHRDRGVLHPVITPSRAARSQRATAQSDEPRTAGRSVNRRVESSATTGQLRAVRGRVGSGRVIPVGTTVTVPAQPTRATRISPAEGP